MIVSLTYLEITLVAYFLKNIVALNFVESVFNDDVHQKLKDVDFAGNYVDGDQKFRDLENWVNRKNTMNELERKYFQILLKKRKIHKLSLENVKENLQISTRNTRDRNHPIKVERRTNAPIIITQSTKHQPMRIKTAVVVYMPQNVNFLYQFVTMLYGSWKYININREMIFNSTAELNIVDLLVFTRQNLFRELPKECKMLDIHDNAGITTPTCWAIHQGFETTSKYKNLNSFIMFLRNDISEILSPYTYVLRTDIDVFLTPSFYGFRPTLDVVTGIGGYSNQFNQQRLRSIAKRLNLKHNSIHNIGSSWYGKTQSIINISKQASHLTRYLYDNEFKPNLDGLESIDFIKHPNGHWPNWYRLTASMYGAELAVNNEITGFSFQNFEHFDTSTCNPNPVWTHYQLHAYHTECEFNKARFMNALTELAIGTSLRRKELLTRLQRFSKMPLENIHKRNCTDYATFIAWHSAGKYLDFNAFFNMQHD